MKTHRIRSAVTIFITMISVLTTQTGITGDANPIVTGLGNATYTGIEDLPLTLSNGHWEGPPYVEDGASRPRAGLLKDIYFSGDLDADGQEEIVAILWQSAGGTGSNTYIAVMKPENEGFENISTTLIGDRVKLRGGKIDSGQIYLEVLQAGEGDPMCCPTQLATRSWSLNDTKLEENVMEVTGKLSPDALNGSEWLLTRIDNGQPLAEDTVVTLSFEAGRISGKSACNRYSASITEGENPGDILIGPTMGTRMACPDHLIEMESLYLASLAQITRFSFNSGSLVLIGQEQDGTSISMFFTPAGTLNK
jgi:heat shock protein HslJ